MAQLRQQLKQAGSAARSDLDAAGIEVARELKLVGLQA